MRSLRRPSEPNVLAQKKAKWTAQFIEQRTQNPRARPASTKYGHKEIRAKLGQMSHYKCFYCEQLIKDKGAAEVDHYLEVAEQPNRAYAWDNLYLACSGCNGAKRSNLSLPAAECVDPCDPEIDPAAHLTFESEYIKPRQGSARGRQTIAKYALARADLDHRRLRELQRFNRVLIAIQEAQISEQGRALTSDEQTLLRDFGAQEHCFSLMFRARLVTVASLLTPDDPT